KVVTDFGFDEVAEAVATQKDGKILAAGGLYDPSTFESKFAVARYLANGSLDTGFGDGGKTVVTFAGQSIASGLAVQADGKIVLAGSGYTFGPPVSSTAELARYNSDGSLDTTFDNDGRVTLATTSGFGDVTIAGSEIVAASGTADGSMAVVRYSADGSLDQTFGSGGIATAHFGD